MSDEPKNLLQHIIELRDVLINSLFGIFIGFIFSYCFIDKIFTFLSRPFQNVSFIYTSVSEIFSTQLKIALYSGIFITFPYIFFQIWKFIAPSFKEKEKQLFLKCVIFSISLFLSGAAFAFYFVIPNILEIFLNNATSQAIFTPKISENISFILILIIAFGISFQMPILVYFLDKFAILKAKTLRKLWREAIIAITVFSAIITPPDIFSMVSLGIPLLILYFGSIFFTEKLLRKR